MSITLSYNGTTLELNPDLKWTDEHSWSPVMQSMERSITGAMLIDYGTRIGGRNISLSSDGDDSGWVPRSSVETLQAWASVAGREMALGMNGVTYQVIFRQLDGAIEASPVAFCSDRAATDWYSVTLRFLEI